MQVAATFAYLEVVTVTTVATGPVEDEAVVEVDPPLSIPLTADTTAPVILVVVEVPVVPAGIVVGTGC